jgi:hypothetical protein
MFTPDIGMSGGTGKIPCGNTLASEVATAWTCFFALRIIAQKKSHEIAASHKTIVFSGVFRLHFRCA